MSPIHPPMPPIHHCHPSLYSLSLRHQPKLTQGTDHQRHWPRRDLWVSGGRGRCDGGGVGIVGICWWSVLCLVWCLLVVSPIGVVLGLVFVGDWWVFFFFFPPVLLVVFALVGSMWWWGGGGCYLAGVCGGGGCYLAGYVWLWLWLWPKVEVVVVGVVEFFWE